MLTRQQYPPVALAFFAAVTVAVIVFTFYETLRFSINFGIGHDEATYVIQSTLDFIAAHGWDDTVRTILPTHERHVLLGMTSTNLLSYALLGKLSFKFINAINVLLLCIASALMVRSYAASREHKLLLACAVFALVLSPVHNECMLVAACTGNHYFGLAFSVTALYFFARQHSAWQFLAAEISSVCAVLSFASGILVPFGGLYLLCCAPADQSRQHNSFRVAAHLLISSSVLLLYYWLTHPAALSVPAFNNLKDVLGFALWLTGYTFSLMGTLMVWLMYDHPLALPVTGLCIALLLGAFVVHYRKGIAPYSLYLSGALVFLGMLMMIALGRFFGPVAPRYAAYNIFFLLFVILLLFKVHDARCDQQHQPAKKDAKYYMLACVAIVHYAVALYYHLPFAYYQENAQQVCIARWNEHLPLNDQNIWCGFNLYESEMRSMIGKAEKLGIYRIDD